MKSIGKNIKQELIPQYQHVLLSIHQLLCLSLGSKALATIACEEGYIFVALVQKMHEKQEIKHLITTIAANIRIGRDYQRVHYKRNKDLCNSEVGTLFEGGKKQPLQLGEACNKIIHAIKFTFVSGEVSSRIKPELKCAYLKPYVILDGMRWSKSKKRDVHWKATLNIEDFAKNAVVASVGYMLQFKEKTLS